MFSVYTKVTITSWIWIFAMFSQSAMAWPSLFAKKFSLQDLPYINVNSYNVLYQKGLKLESPFQPSNGIYKTSGAYMVENRKVKVHITCADDTDEAKMSNSVKIYKSLKSLNLPAYNNAYTAGSYVAIPLRRFSLRKGHCYITPAECEMTLMQHWSMVASLPQRDQLRIESLVLFRIMQGKCLKALDYMAYTGWIYDVDANNICVNPNSMILLMNVESAEYVLPPGMTIHSHGRMPDLIVEKLDIVKVRLQRKFRDFLQHPEHYMDMNGLDLLPRYTEQWESSTGESISLPAYESIFPELNNSE
ncbi:hypothetical protein BDF19DRAFT_465111 [Syncephalis fuscata]|nr:hypothetical protein BDF19DRAFT_465111 [Syncephalis fuscata]